MSSPWLRQAIAEGFLREEEGFGESQRPPRRPVRFEAPTDIRPPSSLEAGADNPLDKTAVHATRVGLNALKFSVT